MWLPQQEGPSGNLSQGKVKGRRVFGEDGESACGVSLVFGALQRSAAQAAKAANFELIDVHVSIEDRSAAWR